MSMTLLEHEMVLNLIRKVFQYCDATIADGCIENEELFREMKRTASNVYKNLDQIKIHDL